jgi:hypothetical protein
MGEIEMDITRFPNETIDTGDAMRVPMPPEADPNSAAPWEEIESGRYMPRRIRGSYRGRELG